MGLGIGHPRCTSSPYAVSNSNPDPNNFRVLEEKAVGDYLMLLVNYPNCTNFEGDKILVFKSFSSAKELLRFTDNKLDPHFARGQTAPIARFPPTENGKAMCMWFLYCLNGGIPK